LILSHKDIIDLWTRKVIKFEPKIEESQISLCSIDLRIGNNFTRLNDNPGITVDPQISKSAGLFNLKTVATGETEKIKGHEFVLGTTFEKITLPNNIAAMVEGRSTFARWGLSAHVTAPLINPGWDGQIALEMFNHGSHSIDLVAGKTRACQLILFKVSKPIPQKIVNALSRYKGQTTPTPNPYS
jgi:dCTP deaminase